MNSSKSIFKRSSTTYFFSSFFFPSNVKQDIADLYNFVRTADNFVDAIPQDTLGLKNFIADLYQDSDNIIVNKFKELEQKYSFEPKWTEAFFNSMLADTQLKTYENIAELEQYIYGSAEVIGLYMCRILNLPAEAEKYAKYQGKAMQLINFIRDISEDLSLGRTYIPTTDLKRFDLSSLEYVEVKAKEANFKALIEFEIRRYKRWQKVAYKGYRLIPLRYRTAIKTATDMYNWTAEMILRNPMLVYNHKVKPSKKKVLLKGIMNMIGPNA